MTAIPANTFILGAGSNGAVNVFRVRFPNAPLAGIPILKAFSTGGANPVANQGANDDHPFSANDSSVFAITTDDKANAAALNDWASTLTSGDANNFGTSPAFNTNGRKLNGNLSYLQLAPDSDDRIAPAGTPASDVSFYFNLAFRVGPLTQTTAGANDIVYGVEYIYTGGTDPEVVWEANAETGGNGATDASPVWFALAGADTDFQGGSAQPVRKIVHANAGTNPAAPVITKPASGKAYSKSAVAQV